MDVVPASSAVATPSTSRDPRPRPPAPRSSVHTPPGHVLLDVLTRMQGSHILTYQFPPEAFVTTPLGTGLDHDLACTLWTQLSLLGAHVQVTDDIRALARRYHLGPVPGLFSVPFYPGINLLNVVYKTAADARAQVAAAQAIGRVALCWLVEFCRALETEAIAQGNGLPPAYAGLLDYYKCLTWRVDDSSLNPCRALVPYGPSPRPLLQSGAPAYSPVAPYVVHPPPGGSPAITPFDFTALTGQEGVGFHGADDEMRGSVVGMDEDMGPEIEQILSPAIEAFQHDDPVEQAALRAQVDEFFSGGSAPSYVPSPAALAHL